MLIYSKPPFNDILISSLFFENRVIPSVMLLRDEHKNPSIFTLLCEAPEHFWFLFVNFKKNCKIKEEIRHNMDFKFR